MKITLKDYAAAHNKNRMTAVQRAERGAFQTAEKIGIQWFIDSEEPWTDGRIKSGKFIGAKRVHE